MPFFSKITAWRKNWHLRFFRYRLFFRLLLLQARLRKKIVVVCRSAGMGDVIGTLPTCRYLALKHLDRQFVYVTHPLFAPLLQMADFSMQIISDKHATLPVISKLFFPSYRPVCADDRLQKPIVNFIQDFALSCGASISIDEKPQLHPPAELLKKIEAQAQEMAAGRPIVTFHTGPTDRVREWPRANWIELTTFLAELGVFVAQLGVDYHTRWGKHDSSHIIGTQSFLNQLSLAETACWIALSDVFVGVDSGLLQMAVALDRPVVAITGPTDMRFRFAPNSRAILVRARGLDCLGCHHRIPRLHWNTGCPFNIACMRQVGALEVFHAVRSVLQSPEIGPTGDPPLDDA